MAQTSRKIAKHTQNRKADSKTAATQFQPQQTCSRMALQTKRKNPRTTRIYEKWETDALTRATFQRHQSCLASPKQTSMEAVGARTMATTWHLKHPRA